MIFFCFISLVGKIFIAKFNFITSGKSCELGALLKSKFIGFLSKIKNSLTSVTLLKLSKLFSHF